MLDQGDERVAVKVESVKRILYRLVRAAEAEIVRRHCAVPRRRRHGNKFAVEIAPGRAMQAKERFLGVAATTAIPIVFEMGSNPIRLGLVTSLRQPGGNVTGVTSSNVEVAPKRLELLHELLPTVRVMAVT